ncbi:MAG TPA: beta-propeller domain-containing protein [Kofleriaceae bacterium]
MRQSIPFLFLAAAVAAACGDGGDRDRAVGQTSFESAPPGGGTRNGGGADSGAGDAEGGVPSPTNPTSSPTRTVEETDLYRLEGNRLYYLNSYRGLMVFDVTNPDAPALLGRSPIFGTPVDMIVRNGVATVVVGDWYGALDSGEPFHGSIVRGLDATDPAHIKVVGEAKLGGWVRDDRVVGDVLYAVSEDYGWVYGWGGEDAVSAPGGGVSSSGGGGGTTTSGPAVVVTSVNFANNQVSEVDTMRFDGFNGVFNVTPNAIMLASAGATYPVAATQLQYLDISDPAGEIKLRGKITVDGAVNGWGSDNGRWNLDFADGKIAHVIGQRYGSVGGYTLSTVDFSKPDAPSLASGLTITNTGWSAAARFDSNRLYLSPSADYWNGTGSTPVQVYDLTAPTAPKLAGSAQVQGQVWNLLPAPGGRMFALGNQYQQAVEGSPVSLNYLDVTNPGAPLLLGTSTFGQGWAWTPATGTFKAFTMDATKGLVVLPFAGWDWTTGTYNNGLQLIQFTPTSITTAGAAKTKGYVERGIFVGNRLVSLSDLALSVVDYSNPMTPKVVTELTLARNVIAARPTGSSIAEVSSDWWGNDVTTSQVRLLPIANAEESADTAAVPTITVDGINARVFNHGSYTYIVTDVRVPGCASGGGGASGGADGTGAPGQTCYQRSQQVEVIQLVNGTATVRGKVQLPTDAWDNYGYGGWGGFWWWDWWGGADVVQVGGDALAFRRWHPTYDAAGNYFDSQSELFVVDASNPDAPSVASTVVRNNDSDWWGNLQAVGDTLYTTHYEWIDGPGERSWVKYYLDSIDLSDRAHPRVGRRVNVPGLLVGGDASDPSIIYTMDYRWESYTNPVNDFDVLKIEGSHARLVAHTPIHGYVGSTFVVGSQVYFSAQNYQVDDHGNTSNTHVDLHALDVSNPSQPRDRVASDAGWGWLLSVTGNRALVTSGWGSDSLDVYKLVAGQKPQFEQTIRTRGWSVNGAARQDNALFLSSGYWGIQKVILE